MIEPVVWETYGNVEIRELSGENIKPITQFVIDCQHDELPLHPKIRQEIHAIYTDFYNYILNKKESLIAVDREKGELIGVIVCLTMTEYMKTWLSLKQIAQEPRIKTIFNLFYLMTTEAHALQPPGTPMDSVLVFRIAVPRQQKGNNWKPKLLNAVMRMTSSFKIPCVTYLAFTVNDQIRAQRAGMIEQNRIYYLQYVDPETFKRPFVLNSNEELCVIFYRRNVETLIPFYKIKGHCIIQKKVKSSRRYYNPNYILRKGDVHFAEFVRKFRKLNNIISENKKDETEEKMTGNYKKNVASLKTGERKQ